MSNDEDRTLVRRDYGAVGATLVSPRTEPTSWNGISYDDMMRTLEDALPVPANDLRATVVDAQYAPTRPVAFEPMAVTQRMPGRPAAELHARAPVAAISTVAPVALPTRYVDLDGDIDLDDLEMNAARTVSCRAVTSPAPKNRIGKGFLLGAVLGMFIAAGAYAYGHPDARTSASMTASGARARVSSWVANAKGAKAAAAPPPAAAPIAEPAQATPVTTPVTTPVMTAEPSIPTMRAPTAPPPFRVVKAKRVDADETKAAEVEADPTSLLDRGLGD